MHIFSTMDECNRPVRKKRRLIKTERKNNPSNHLLEIVENNTNVFPIMNLGARTGWTDYIDFIQPEDFASTKTIMQGSDKWERKFITVRHEEGVVTIFQRYTHYPNYWAAGGQQPVWWKHGSFDINDVVDLRYQWVLHKVIPIYRPLLCAKLPFYADLNTIVISYLFPEKKKQAGNYR